MTTAPDPAAESGPELYTTAQLAGIVGLSERDARRFFRAMGFPDADEDELRWTDADLAVLTVVIGAVRTSEVDLASAVRLVRAVGQNVARLSDWQVAAMATRAEQVAEQTRGDADDEVASRHDGAQRIADEVADALQLVLVHAWRRHLTAAMNRLDLDPDTDDEQCVTTVGFADLVSFSAMSNELDTNRLGDLVELFEARCGDVIAAHEGRLIKTLGDSVLFVVDDAERAMDIACGLIEVIGQDSRLPDVRIGLASGQVVTRMGDVFGPPVNLAARLTALARRNRVIVDDATAEVLVEAGFEVRRLTARPVRGFGLVEPVAVRLQGGRG